MTILLVIAGLWWAGLSLHTSDVEAGLYALASSACLIGAGMVEVMR